MGSGVSHEAVEIPATIRDEMLRHALDGLPEEACGLLAGPNGRVERFWAMENADHSSVTYRLEPRSQLAVFNEIEDLGWRLLGIFHSHTHTEAYPSPTDRRLAFYPEARYLVLSLADRGSPVFRAFTIRDGEVEEREVRIV